MTFEILAVEECETFGPEVAERMKLPFDYGWDHWEIFQGSTSIASFTNYEDARATLSALTNIQFMQLAA